MPHYAVNLQIYAGPLDLLLYLVRQRELDIDDISVAQITDQFIQYLDLIRELDINFAAEFLVMASTLMLMKVRAALPNEDIALDDDTDDPASAGPDPRVELIKQLLEYKKFKDAASLLRDRADEHSLRVPRRAGPDFPPASVEDVLESVSLWDLMKAFKEILDATGAPTETVLREDDVPVRVHMEELIDLLRTAPDNRLAFHEAFLGKTSRLALIGVFLAILESARLRRIRIEQQNPFGPILISLRPDSEWYIPPENDSSNVPSGEPQSPAPAPESPRNDTP